MKKIVAIIVTFTLGMGLYASKDLRNSEIDESKESKVFYDSPTTDLANFFNESNKTYHIRHHHTSTSPIVMPDSCIISFEGGSISAPINFLNTRLSGHVKLNGSHISGSIINEVFDASWICNMDGKTDDASYINQILEVANNIYFPKGQYYLEAITQPTPEDIPESLYHKLRCHISIHKSNVRLFGSHDACFVTSNPDNPVKMIYIYSAPGNINNSISNIQIENLTFIRQNTETAFYERAHTIKLCGVKNCVIANCRFQDFWGDAILLGCYGDTPSTGERTRNQNVLILNNYINGNSHNNRNAISVCSAKDVSIINNVIEDVTSPKKMPGAIDIEADNAAYTVDGITICNNKISGSKGFGGAITIVSKKNAPAHNIIIDHNTISNSNGGIALGLESDNCVSNITITGNTIDKDTPAFIFEGSGKTVNWVVKDNIYAFDNKDFVNKNKKIKFSGLFLQ